MDELRMQADNEVMTEDKNRHAEDDNDMTDGEISAHHAQHTAPSHKSFHHSVSRIKQFDFWITRKGKDKYICRRCVALKSNKFDHSSTT